MVRIFILIPVLLFLGSIWPTPTLGQSENGKDVRPCLGSCEHPKCKIYGLGFCLDGNPCCIIPESDKDSVIPDNNTLFREVANTEDFCEGTCEYKHCIKPGKGFCFNGNPCCKTVHEGASPIPEEQIGICVVTCEFKTCRIPGVGICFNGHPCCISGYGDATSPNPIPERSTVVDVATSAPTMCKRWCRSSPTTYYCCE